MRQQAVIFDLDGTLLDTLADLGTSVNRVLAERGLPTHELEAFRWFIGDGSAMLIARALPPEERLPETIQSCLQALLEDYGQNWNTFTRPFDGIPALLQTLSQRHVPTSVVTNKPHRFAVPMTAYFFEPPFRCVFGQRDGIPKKPDPFQALAAAQEMHVPPADCIFLGDSAIDIQTARSAGMLAVGVAWGFRPVEELHDAGAAHVIDRPLDLLTLMNA